jgi:hypothetical protein
MRLDLRLFAMLFAGCVSAAATATATAQTGQGWLVDVTWRYEAQSGRTLREGRTGPGGADTRLSATAEAKIAVEARGTMEFSGKLRGAAAVNMPDSRNEQRYDSWRFRGGKPAFASVDMAAQLEQAARINQADGEGANLVNAERKGLVGRVQHTRERFELKASGDDAGWFGDHADLQIDRVANKLMIINRIDLQPNRKVARPTRSHVQRMDKPAAAGEWDRSAADEEAWRTLPHMMLRDVIEFDIPPGADQFTLTRTYEAGQLPDPLDSLGFPFPSDLRDATKLRDKYHRGRATLTLNVRRLEAAAAASVPAPAAAAPAAPAAAPASPSAPQKTEPAKPAQPSATDEALDAVKKLRGLLGR